MHVQLHRQPEDAGEALDDLIRRARAGDPDAFEKIVRLHYRFIYRSAYKWLGNSADAEDIAQSICIKLSSVIGSYDGRAAFTTWLHRVVLNAVRDWQRSQVRRQRQLDTVAREADDVAFPDQDQQMRVDDIWRIVRSLPEKQRDAVLLVYGEQMSQAEAARVMGCKEVTVSWHIHKARKALKGML